MYGLLFACNAVMLTCYVRSLRRLPSLQATLISNAANIALTGVLGHCLFAEPLTPRWALGVLLVVGGLALISLAASPPAGSGSSVAGGVTTIAAGAALATSDGTDPPGGAGPQHPQPAPAPPAAAPPTSWDAGELGAHSHRLVLSYDGTAYSGWQLQRSSPTVQGAIERALSTVLREGRATLCVCGAGRTDAGVHAAGQVVQFYTHRTDLDPERLPYRLNSLLPPDIRVLAARRTAPDFVVTCSAISKTYHYSIDTSPFHNPLTFRQRMHARRPLNLAAMRAAAATLVGTHDFTQMSNDSPERAQRNPVKTMHRVDVLEAQDGSLRLEVEGSGFLYKQVRHMAGVLVAVGEGALGEPQINAMLALGRGRAPGAGGTWRGYNVAPAKGLCMMGVRYPPQVDDPGCLLYPELPHDEHGRLVGRMRGPTRGAELDGGADGGDSAAGGRGQHIAVAKSCLAGTPSAT